jgi:hypothetical protein
MKGFQWQKYDMDSPSAILHSTKVTAALEKSSPLPVRTPNRPRPT